MNGELKFVIGKKNRVVVVAVDAGGCYCHIDLTEVEQRDDLLIVGNTLMPFVIQVLIHKCVHSL